MKNVKISMAMLFAVAAITMVSCKNAEPTVTEPTTTEVPDSPTTTTEVTDTTQVETTADTSAVKSQRNPAP